ncbi:MAG: hypothetical protein ACD_65C00130G0002 [uncultured bacterium]|nr:MAG: hypothetical protein ACD_65C00130G0002 [uncultured bacterium]KKT01898.1 MAG: hypothetical protein UV80_C0007G0012 [Candidatus Peregrinibacteria bacterium GW2011_GWF2_43_17]
MKKLLAMLSVLGLLTAFGCLETEEEVVTPETEDDGVAVEVEIDGGEEAAVVVVEPVTEEVAE